MIDEIRKSINSTLYQRATSPLYGTLAITWLVWNWKIWYLTIFVDQDSLSTTKLNYIVCNYGDPIYLVWLPLLSTALLLTLVQFISNGAYWLDIKFKIWRINQRNGIEGKQLLTLEQSIRLRTEIREQEQNFDKLLEKKDEEIDLLTKQISDLQSRMEETTEQKDEIKETSGHPTEPPAKGSNVLIGTDYSNGDFNRLKRNAKILENFEYVTKNLRDKNLFPPDTGDNIKEYFITNELVQADRDSIGNRIYKLTFKGRRLYKEFYNDKYDE